MKKFFCIPLVIFFVFLFNHQVVFADQSNADSITRKMVDYAKKLEQTYKNSNPDLVQMHKKLPEGGRVCFSRKYTKAHLLKTKKQSVQSVFLTLTREDNDATSSGKGFLIDIDLKTKSTNSPPKIYGHCKLSGICGTGESRGENVISIKPISRGTALTVDLKQIQIFSNLKQYPYEEFQFQENDDRFLLFKSVCHPS